MTESQMKLRCGVPDCDWEIVLPESDEDWPACYMEIKAHYWDAHGMDPKFTGGDLN